MQTVQQYDQPVQLMLISLITLQASQESTSYCFFKLKSLTSDIFLLQAITDEGDKQCFIAFDEEGLPVEDACVVLSSSTKVQLNIQLQLK